MKLPDELARLARHLMLFLVAVLAFASKGLFENSSCLVRGLFIASLVLAFLSFLAGYAGLFRLFNDKNDRILDRSSALGGRVTPRAIQIVRLQFFLGILALGLLIADVITGPIDPRL